MFFSTASAIIFSYESVPCVKASFPAIKIIHLRSYLIEPEFFFHVRTLQNLRYLAQMQIEISDAQKRGSSVVLVEQKFAVMKKKIDLKALGFLANEWMTW